MNRIKVINEPSELVPMLRAVDTPVKREVLKALEKGKPLNIAGIAPKIIEEARQRDITLTEALDGETALKKWLGAKDTIDEKQAGKVMQLFKKYSEELVENQDVEQAEG